MSQQQIAPFHLIGISVRTSNDPGKADVDIPALWSRFMTEGVKDKIQHRVEEALYCVYTNYEGDHTQPYTTFLGCRVANLEITPEGLEGLAIDGGRYEIVTAKGNILEGMVFNAWLSIWNTALPRNYKADFEVYDEKAADLTKAEVSIYIGVQ